MRRKTDLRILRTSSDAAKTFKLSIDTHLLVSNATRSSLDDGFFTLDLNFGGGKVKKPSSIELLESFFRCDIRTYRAAPGKSLLTTKRLRK